MEPGSKPRFRPYQKPETAGHTLADIERQENAERLRSEAADKEIFGDDEEYDDRGNRPLQKPRKKRRVLHFLGWILLTALLTAGVAGAGWYFVLRKISPETKSSQQTEAPKPAAEAAVDLTDTHSSSAFQLQFDYPKNWKVTDNPDNTITAVSPVTKLKVASAKAPKNQDGQVILTIRHKQQSLPEFKSGDAEAALESDKIDYAKPSQVQRGSTYVSYLSYVSSAARGIDAVYVTGDNGYQKNQLIPFADISKSDPLITLSFRACLDTRCSSPGEPVSIDSSQWQDTLFSKPLKTILQSIVAD